MTSRQEREVIEEVNLHSSIILGQLCLHDFSGVFGQRCIGLR